jgi:hypothetical protein
MTDHTSERDRVYAVVGLSSSADFCPEECPDGFIEWTFRLPRSVAVAVGFYTVSFLRALTSDEIADEGAAYASLAALSPSNGGSGE